MTMDHCLRGLFVFPPLVAVCLLTATALGQQRSDRFQGTSVAELVQQRLATYDKDGDGKVWRDEAAGPMRGAKQYAAQPKTSQEYTRLHCSFPTTWSGLSETGNARLGEPLPRQATSLRCSSA